MSGPQHVHLDQPVEPPDAAAVRSLGLREERLRRESRRGRPRTHLCKAARPTLSETANSLDSDFRDHVVVQLLEAARQPFGVEGRRRDHDARHSYPLERLQLLDSRAAHARQLDLARVASDLAGLGLHEREQFLELGNFGERGEEAVAVASGAFGGRRRMAADMNRYAAFLDRLREALDRAEVEMFAVE